MTRQKSSRGLAAVALFAVAFLLLTIPMLARTPQNPDGAELVMAAVRGGVLHPPGFPLQAWLDRAIVALAPGGSAYPFSVESLLVFVAALLLLGCLYLLGGVSASGTILSLATFAFFPAAWRLALEPEKYALTFALIGGFCLVCLLSGRSKKWTLRHPLAAGLLFGLALAQHPLAVLSAPFAFLVLSRAPKRQRLAGLCALASTSFVVAGGFYVSLLWLRRPGGWPDWGKLTTLSEVARHLLRLDYPPMALAVSGANAWSAVAIWAAQLWDAFHAGIALAAVGVIGGWTLRREPVIRAFAASLAASVLFLAVARLGADQDVVIAYLERYGVLAMIFMVPLVGLGFDEIRKRAPRRLLRAPWFFPGCAVVLAGLLALNGRSAADASHDETIDLYSDCLGAELPAGALYVGREDLEGLYGVPTGQGRRFPIAGDFPWYLMRVVPLLEPRLRTTGAHPAGLYSIIESARARGLPIYSADFPLLAAGRPGVRPEPRGVLWATGASGAAPESLAAARRLCRCLDRSSALLNRDGQPYSRFLWKRFSGAFFATAEFLSAGGRRDDGERARAVAFSVLSTRDPGARRAACGELIGREGRQ